MARDGCRRLDEIKRAFPQRGETREEGLGRIKVRETAREKILVSFDLSSPLFV